MGNHAYISERAIYKLKLALTKFILHRNTARYIDNLQQIVDSVNRTYHTGLGTTPYIAWHARGDQFAQIFMHQYWDPERFKKPKGEEKRLSKAKIRDRVKRTMRPRYHFKMTDIVRIALDDSNDKLTHKAYSVKWSNETFTIETRRMLEGVDYYTIKDARNEVLSSSFHFSELQKVTVPDDPVFKISRIIKRKRVRGETWCYISWVGYGPRENSWIKQKDIVDA